MIQRGKKRETKNCYHMIDKIVSVLAIGSTIAVSLIGFPEQIREIRKAKHVKALSVLFFCLVFIAFSLFTLHGYLRRDKTVFIGQGLGAIGSGITLAVIFYTTLKQTNRGA